MYIADFETTVEEDTSKQEYSEVWAFGIARLFDGTERVNIGNSINAFWSYLLSLKEKHIIVYFHNLKFDGTFILYDLIENRKFYPAFVPDPGNTCKYKQVGKFKENKELKAGEFTTVITDNGIWYSIIVKFEKTLIEFRDSLKLLPMSISEMGKAFNTRARKLELDYKAHKGAREKIDDFEKAYIANDIRVPKEALEFFLTEMHYENNPPLTISQAALREFKKDYSKSDWQLFFPNLAEQKLDPELYGSENMDEYCRKAYGGGWCYADSRRTGLINGITHVYDVNSLYSSVEHSKSGNRYPYGVPTMIKNSGDFRKFPKDCFYIIRFTCRFKLYEGYLPFIQCKYDPFYRNNENLKNSFKSRDGLDISSHQVELTLTRPMFELMADAYSIKDFKFLDAAVFYSEIGMFDKYINRFIAMKQKATEEGNKGRRTIAKLFLNGLYGKFGTDPVNTFYLVKPDNKGDVVYTFAEGENKKPVYVPIAAATTGYARRFTVKAATLNYEYYTYSDTDSVHMTFPKSWSAEKIAEFKPKGIELHDTDLLCWKLESVNDNSLYVRQKTYIDFSPNKVYTDDLGNEQRGLYDIKACGLPERGKLLFESALKGLKANGNILEIPHEKKTERLELTPNDIEFLTKKRYTIDDFKSGLSIPGKLAPKKIKGGCVLVETNFTII